MSVRSWLGGMDYREGFIKNHEHFERHLDYSYVQNFDFVQQFLVTEKHGCSFRCFFCLNFDSAILHRLALIGVSINCLWKRIQGT